MERKTRSEPGHTKSRHGCTQYPELAKRTRRVKCDETKPACRRCSVRDDPCTYPSSTASSPGTVLNNASPRPPVEQLKANRQREGRSPTHKLELRLLHHFAHFTLGSIEAFHPYEHRAVLTSPAVLEHTYLLDTTFALASLHIAFQDSDHAQDYREIASIYEDRALKGCPTIDISQDCLALFNFSALIGMVRLARSRFPLPTTQKNNCISTFVEIARLWRGSVTIVSLAVEQMTPKEGDHYFVSSYKKSTPSAPRHGDLFLAMLEQLEQHIATVLKALPQDHQQTRREMYADSISLLKEAAWPKIGTIFLWPCDVGDDFLNAVVAGDSCARLITLAWCPLMRRFDLEWWSLNFGSELAIELRQGVEWVPAELDAWCAASQVPALEPA